MMLKPFDFIDPTSDWFGLCIITFHIRTQFQYLIWSDDNYLNIQTQTYSKFSFYLFSVPAQDKWEFLEPFFVQYAFLFFSYDDWVNVNQCFVKYLLEDVQYWLS